MIRRLALIAGVALIAGQASAQATNTPQFPNVTARVLSVRDFPGVTCNLAYGTGPATIASGNATVTLADSYAQSRVGERISFATATGAFNTTISAISGTSVTLAAAPGFNAPLHYPYSGTLAAAGSGYVAGDTITLSNGTVITVLTVDTGAVETWSVLTPSADAAAPGATVFTQTSTSGVGTGFTTTLVANRTGNYIVGKDDGAAINAGLAALPSTSSATVTVPGCLTTVQIVEPNGVTLAGLDWKLPGLALAGPAASLFEGPTSIGRGGGVRNLLIDAWMNAPYACRVLYGLQRRFEYMNCRNGTTKTLMVGSDVQNSQGNYYNYVLAQTDITFPALATLPTHNLHVGAASSDNRFSDVHLSNASAVNMQSDGSGENHFSEVHAFGYPTYTAAVSCYLLNGDVSVTDSTCDNATLKPWRITGFGTSVINPFTQMAGMWVTPSMYAYTLESGAPGARACNLIGYRADGFDPDHQVTNLSTDAPGCYVPPSGKSTYGNPFGQANPILSDAPIAAPLSLAGSTAGMQNIGATKYAGYYQALAFFNSAAGSRVSLGHSRSTTVGAFSALQVSDSLGRIIGFGDDGVSYDTVGGDIRFIVGNTVSEGVVPTSFMLNLMTAAGVFQNAVCIDPSGSIYVAASSTTSGACSTGGVRIADHSGNLYDAGTLVSTTYAPVASAGTVLTYTYAGAAPAIGSTTYMPVSGFSSNALSGAETTWSQIWNAASTASNLTCKVGTAPGTGETVTISLRVAASDPASGPTVTISGTSTAAVVDSTNTAAIAASQTIAYKVVQSTLSVANSFKCAIRISTP